MRKGQKTSTLLEVFEDRVSGSVSKESLEEKEEQSSGEIVLLFTAGADPSEVRTGRRWCSENSSGERESTVGNPREVFRKPEDRPIE
jgi:hypothetical protein